MVAVGKIKIDPCSIVKLLTKYTNISDNMFCFLHIPNFGS
jgi:hypothetical protein